MKKQIHAAFKISLGASAFIASMPAAYAQETAAGGIEQVFVTARKRDEGVQAVPIAITALSADTLAERGVREVQDLNLVVPGFRFGASGGKANNDVILRGLSKIPLGDGISAVVTYFNNVALPSRGGNVPTYDIANIQVLKGPQGTLFGRNTLGGAVVIASEAPSYEFGGYVKGVYGTKNYRNLEGAVNVPIVDDKVALRLAGQTRRQDGLDKNLSNDQDFNNIHQDSYRISLLVNPTDTIESTTVYDYLNAPERAASGYLVAPNPSALAPTAAAGVFNFIPAANPAIPGPALTLGQQIDYYVAQGHQAGIHAGFTQLPDGGAAKRKLWGISNDTSWDTGSFTVRNILGYRRVGVAEAISTGAVGPTTAAIPNAFPFNDPTKVGPAFAGLVTGLNNAAFPLTLFNAAADINRAYLSDEFQLFGNALDDRLDWIAGAFYNKDKSSGENGTTFTAFSPFSRPAPAVASHVENTNRAVFGQIGLDLSEWTVEGLKLNLGMRRSWDKVSACGGTDLSNPNQYLNVGDCYAFANRNNPFDGIGIIKADDSETSYTWGFDWQINPDTLVYLTSRRGYRGVNANTPKFETPFTTGATPAEVAASPLAAVGPCGGVSNPQTCPDLRPYQTTEPEYLTDYEIGFKNDWSIGDVKGRFNIAAYTSKYKNSVQFVTIVGGLVPNGTPDAPSSGAVGVNAADLTIRGVEADLTVIPVPSLTLTLSGAYTDQHIDKLSNGLTEHDVTLPSPKFAGTFGFAWVTPVNPLDGDLVLSGDYYKTDDFSGQHGINLPGYELANFRLAWNGIAKSQLDLAVYVKNAFDEDYFISPTVSVPAFPMVVYQPGEPRTWGVEANYKF